MSQSFPHPKVIIIGAGLSGLTAAHLLKKANMNSLLLLEADGRAGGRIRNQPISPTVNVEGGAAWVGPTHTHLLTLAQELGISTFPTYNEGRNVFVFGGKRTAYRGTLPTSNWPDLVDAGLTLSRLERMTEGIVVGAPWQSPHAEDFDRLTLEAWLRRVPHTRFTHLILYLITGASFGCTPRAISLLHFLAHIRSAGGLQQLIGVHGAALEQRFVGGSEVLIQRLSERMEGVIRLRTPVRSIAQERDHVIVETEGQYWQTEHVIVAMNPAAIEAIRFTSALPPQRAALVHRWTSGTGMKVHAVYDTPFWRMQGLSGQAVSDTGVVRLTFDSTPPEGTPGILTGLLGLPTAPASLLEDGQSEQRRMAVLSSFVRYFGEPASHPKDYLECDWTHHPWIGGCLPSLPPGVLTECGPALHEPCGRLHWAGAETSDIWEGHMEGAVRSAERVVQEILAKTGLA